MFDLGIGIVMSATKSGEQSRRKKGKLVGARERGMGSSLSRFAIALFKQIIKFNPTYRVP